MQGRIDIAFVFAFVSPALVALHLAGCTQDFGVFAGAGGAGVASSSSSSSSSSSGTSSSSSSSSSSGASSSSSSSSSSSGASSSSSSSSGSSSSSSGSTVEVCANGVDDDGDGDTDCADSACTATHTCVSNAPSGWNGPVALYDGDAATAPACPATHPTKAYEGHGDLVAEPAVCAACTCSAPSVACSPKPLSIHPEAGCTTTNGTAVQPAIGQCSSLSPPSGASAVSAAEPAASASPCTADGGDKTLPPPKWGRVGLTCSGGGVGLGCGAGKACTARPAAPFEPGLCVWRSGNVACPSGFPDKHLFTDSVVDTRDCTGCGCGAPSGSCTVTTRIHANGGCNGAALQVPNDGSCVSLTGNAASMEIDVATTGSCPPLGGQPVGSIVPGALSTTVCCAP